MDAPLSLMGKKLSENFTRIYVLFWTNPWRRTLQKPGYTATCLSSYKPSHFDGTIYINDKRYAKFAIFM